MNMLGKPKERYMKAFFIAMATAFAFFIPFIVMDKGYFLFYGDFNVQQIPFYKIAHEALRNGNFFWNWKTDLGANFIGSYSFYLLGSPFFWLTLPFPTDFLPHLMGPLLILKFSCASLTAYLFLSRFVRNKNLAVIGGLLYAFSGFSVYNIFFNHFHEAIVLFPLLLLGMELLMVDNLRGPFLFAVFACLLSNYFFFVGMVVFVLIYYILRTLSGDWNVSIGKFLNVGLEAVLGCALAMFIMLPTIMAVTQNSRVSSVLTGWGGLMFGKEQIYAYVSQSFFFPPDLPARPVFFTGADVKWSSVAGWMPVFSMVGVIAWLQAKRGNWLRRILLILAVMAFIPFLNSSFYMFNSAYYARWFFMPILMMALATVMGLEDEQVNWRSGWAWTFGITLAFSLAIGLFPSGMTNGKFTGFGLYDKKYTDRFWITCGVAIAGLIVMRLLMRLMKQSVRVFTRTAIACVCILSVVYASYFIAMGKSHSYSTTDFIIPHLLQGADSFTIDGRSAEDIDERVDVFDGMDNTTMFLNLNGLQAFHSIVPASIVEFYDYIGVERGVGSRPSVESYAIRSLLSVRYLLDSTKTGDSFQNGNDTKMPYFTLLESSGGFDVYENQCYIPYGFTYDRYMTSEYSDTFSKQDRQKMMLKAMLLSDEQVQKYGALMADLSLAGENDDDLELHYPDTYSPDLSESAYQQDCINRAALAAEAFSIDNTGFSARISLEDPNLVFFSVPYDDGWTATVNGSNAMVEKVNVGFMAVEVPAGENIIRFTYTTPGLKQGIWISLGGLVLTILYLLVCLIVARVRRRRAQVAMAQHSGGLPAGNTPFMPSYPTSPAPQQSGPGIRPSSYSADDFFSGRSPLAPDQPTAKTNPAALDNAPAQPQESAQPAQPTQPEESSQPTQPTQPENPDNAPSVIDDFDEEKFRQFLDGISDNTNDNR